MSVGIATTPTMSKMTNGIKFHKKVSISFKSDVKLKEESLHIDVEARVGVPKSTIAETGMGVTSRP